MARNRLRLTAVAVVALVALALTPVVVVAATPAAGIGFTGTSAHGLFTLSVTTSCADNGDSINVVCARPSFVRLRVTPTTKLNPGCLSDVLSTGYQALTGTNEFSAKFYRPSSYHVTVEGRFVSPRTVTGTVAAVGPGCQSDTFRIVVAPLVSNLSPCEILTRVSAARIVAKNVTSYIGYSTFSREGGECNIEMSTKSVLILVLAPSFAALQLVTGGMTSAPVNGLSAGAAIHTMTVENLYTVVVVFHHHSTWAGLTFLHFGTPCASSSSPPTCVSSGVKAQVRGHVVDVARRVLPLL